MKTCISKRENSVLNQLLKIQEVEELIKDKIAKGEKRTKTSIKIYLKEYIKIKLKKPTETKLFIIPSKEKILNSLVLMLILLFIEMINSAKLMLCPVIFCPIS